MTVRDQLHDASESSLFVWLVGAVVGAFWWTVRTLLTNKGRIDAMEKKTDEIHKDVREIRNALMQSRSE